jgi:choline dehydrogenase-like flavoprotein
LFTPLFYPRKAPVFRFRGTLVLTLATRPPPHPHQPLPVKHSMPEIHRSVPTPPHTRPSAAVKQLAWPQAPHPRRPETSPQGAVCRCPPFGNGTGAAMSSSPFERLWNGDEDVAIPFHTGAVSRCATKSPAGVSPLAGAGSF